MAVKHQPENDILVIDILHQLFLAGHGNMEELSNAHVHLVMSSLPISDNTVTETRVVTKHNLQLLETMIAG